MALSTVIVAGVQEKYVGIFLSLHAFSLFIKNLSNKKKFKLKHQLNYLGTYYPRLNTDLNGWIDWNLKSYQIERFINAFDDPYLGASTFLRNKRVRLKKTYLSSSDTGNHPFMSGLIRRHDKKWVVVSANDQNVLLVEVVLDDKGNNILSKLKVGDRFITSERNLFLAEKILKDHIIFIENKFKNKIEETL